jgi:hypothetical protein
MWVAGFMVVRIPEISRWSGGTGCQSVNCATCDFYLVRGRSGEFEGDFTEIDKE